MPVVPVPCDCGGAPCPPISSTGLCLADGTPIAVVYSRDCDSGAMTELGFINLLTGIFTPGMPPAGTRACGERDFELTNWCDLAADGSVIAHVLVEYQYDEETGQLVGSRLLDPLGQPYNGGNGPVGTLGSCGTADEVFQHQEQLCDFRPGAPGAPILTADAAVSGTAHNIPPAQKNMGVPTDIPLATSQQFFDGQAISVGPGGPNEHTYTGANLTAVADCGTLDPAGSSTLHLTARITNTGANCGCGLWGYFKVWDGNTDLTGVAGYLGILGNAAAGSICPGQVVTKTITVVVPNASLIAGTIDVTLNVQTGEDTTSDGLGCPVNNPGGTTYTLDQFAATVDPVAVVGCAGPAADGPVVPFIRKYIENAQGVVLDTVDLTFDGLGYQVQGNVGRCVDDDPETTFGLPLCDVLPDGTVVPFVRTYTVNCGEVVQSCDKDLGGVDDYDPVGTVSVCASAAGSGTGGFEVEQQPLCVVDDATGGVLQEIVGEFVYDTATGALSVVRYVDRATGAPVAVPGGAHIAACPDAAADCRRCETVQLCDTVTPAGVIPTPADGFTLTGNVTVSNISLVYSLGEQPPNGVASMVLSPLVPGAQYSVSFKAGFQGTGPTGSQAIYLAEVLDGAAVIASSGDVNVTARPEPGLPTLEQPPLVFTAPASGQATLRYSDHTTLNGDTRDLILDTEQVTANVGGANPVVTPFLRTICRDCDGAVTGVTNTGLDGTTVYDPQGVVSDCAAGQQVFQHQQVLCDLHPDGSFTSFIRKYVEDADGNVLRVVDLALGGGPYVVDPLGEVAICSDPPECIVTPVCFKPNGYLEFISNRANETSVGGDANPPIDGDWKWSTVPGVGPFYDMYPGPRNLAWACDTAATTLCGDTPQPQYSDVGWYVGAHPGTKTQTRGNGGAGLPNEGPSFTPVPFDWYPTATFLLPPNADPATIMIAATALTADQVLVEWRLNNGPWQVTNTPFGASGAFPAQTVPGAQAGLNRITLHVRETSPIDDSEGLLAHLIVTYQVDDTVTWSKVTCPTGASYYLDDQGARQDVVPQGWTAVDCQLAGGRDAEPVLLCDVMAGEIQDYDPTLTAQVPPVAHGEHAISSTVAGFMVDPTPLFTPGGTLTIPTWSTNPGTPRDNAVAGVINSSGPLPCGTPTDVRVQVKLTARNGGSTININPASQLTLRNGATIIDTHSQTSAPTGVNLAYVVDAVVPWADVVAGNVTWYWWGAVYRQNNLHAFYDLSGFEVTISDAAPIDGCGDAATIPFVRHYVYNGDGTLRDHYDTDIDGAPYFPAGVVKSCAAAGTATAVAPEIDRVVQPLCDFISAFGLTTPFLRHWTVNNTTGALTLIGNTTLDGTTVYNPSGTVTVCGANAGGPDALLNTGIRRLVNNTLNQALKTEFVGLQSVTLTVLAGAVNVTATNGAAQQIPAGVSLTWSVEDTDDSSLQTWSATGLAGSDYILNWTYKASAGG